MIKTNRKHRIKIQIIFIFVGLILVSTFSFAKDCQTFCPFGAQKTIQSWMVNDYDLNEASFDVSTILYAYDQHLNSNERKKFWDEHSTWLQSRFTQCSIPVNDERVDLKIKQKSITCLIKMYKSRFYILSEQVRKANLQNKETKTSTTVI